MKIITKKHILNIVFNAIFIFLFFSSCVTKAQKQSNTNFDFLPTSTNGAVVYHQYFTLSYVEKYEQAEWVAYKLHKSDLVKSKIKRPYFKQDIKVLTGSANWKNFKNSGYTKGHLLPAADRKFSKEAYYETFLTSNISPQLGSFNGGIWLDLEKEIRYWAKQYNEIYVVTGGILHENTKSIGYEKVAVPNYFYKVILVYTEKETKAIAFLIPHKKLDKPLQNYVVSIDTIEKLTGIDFFPVLPNRIERRLERSSDFRGWNFK